MRYKSGGISEFYAGLNVEGLKKEGREMNSGVSKTTIKRLVEGIDIYIESVTFSQD